MNLLMNRHVKRVLSGRGVARVVQVALILWMILTALVSACIIVFDSNGAQLALVYFQTIFLVGSVAIYFIAAYVAYGQLKSLVAQLQHQESLREEEREENRRDRSLAYALRLDQNK